MKNSSQTQHCRSKIRGKNSIKQKKLEHYRNAFPASTVHPASTVLAAPILLHFTLLSFLLQFLVFSHFILVIAFSFSVFFFVISLALSRI